MKEGHILPQECLISHWKGLAMDLHFCTLEFFCSLELTLLDHCMSALTASNKRYMYACLHAHQPGEFIELTADLSAVTFLQAFRWFTSRRGLPATIYSDNAKTFKSASSDVKKTYMVNHQVEWKYIVEKAPWWGGLGEDGWYH